MRDTNNLIKKGDKMDGLISRSAAIECTINAADDWDGGWSPNREIYIRKYFEELPAVDAIPVEWLEKKQREGFHRMCAKAVLDMWKNEQGINDG